MFVSPRPYIGCRLLEPQYWLHAKLNRNNDTFLCKRLPTATFSAPSCCGLQPEKSILLAHPWQLCSKYSTPDRNISVADSEMNKDALENNKISQMFTDSGQKDKVVNVFNENIVKS